MLITLSNDCGISWIHILPTDNSAEHKYRSAFLRGEVPTTQKQMDWGQNKYRHPTEFVGDFGKLGYRFSLLHSYLVPELRILLNVCASEFLSVGKKGAQEVTSHNVSFISSSCFFIWWTTTIRSCQIKEYIFLSHSICPSDMFLGAAICTYVPIFCLGCSIG